MKVTLSSMFLVTLLALVGCVQEEAARTDQLGHVNRATSNGAQF